MPLHPHSGGFQRSAGATTQGGTPGGRREFLRGLGGLVICSMARPQPAEMPARPLPRKLESIGLQLYTVRSELARDFEGTLDRVAAIGYREVAFAGYFGRMPGEVKAALRRAGLDAPAAHLPSSVLPFSWERAVEAAVAIGHRYLICAFLTPSERPNLEAYRRIAAIFNRAGEVCRKAGLQFAYHNHEFEFAPLEGQVPYDLLLAETDPELVKMEMDLYWITRGNRDPLEYFEKYPGRFPLFHIKDMDNTPKRGQTEVGRGIIDFKRIFARAARAGTRHFFVEHDDPASPLESARISCDYLKRLEF